MTITLIGIRKEDGVAMNNYTEPPIIRFLTLQNINSRIGQLNLNSNETDDKMYYQMASPNSIFAICDADSSACVLYYI